MEINQFKEMEKRFHDLKIRLENGEINIEDFKRELKKLVVLDKNGFYWMLGSKSGNWFRYNGREWVQESPYAQEEKQEVEQQTVQFEQKVGFSEEKGMTLSGEKRETVAQEATLNIELEKREKQKEEQPKVNCPYCKKSNIADNEFCAYCGKNLRGRITPATPAPGVSEEQLLVKKIDVVSTIYFGGGSGMIIGIVFGVLFGILNILPDLMTKFPLLFQNAHGKLQGGLIFGALGGLCGFFAFALFFVLQALFFNFISGMFGSLRITVKHRQLK